MIAIKRLTAWITADVKNENESKKTAIVLRILGLVMCTYFLMLAVMFAILGDSLITVGMILSLVAMAGVIYLTYCDATKWAMLFLQSGMLLWIICMVAIQGWDTGVQHFLFVAIVFYCLTGQGSRKKKIFFATFLCTIRLVLYFYCRMHAPVLPLTELTIIAFQILNTIAMFANITVISLVFSMDSQEMEQKLVEYNKNLQQLASTDELTGLYNRRTMTNYLENRSKQRNAKSCSVAIGDIDFFKKVNDNYGHEGGDVVLRQLSALMKQYMVGKGDIARWGGEEFLLVFEAANGDLANEMLFGLLKQIRNLRIPYAGEELAVTMTFGLTEFSSSQDINEIIKEADEKLYRGKESGRDKIVY
ncbi:MAG: GGDEF domain-containing protein [Lachnospiraceae bacterium]